MKFYIRNKYIQTDVFHSCSYREICLSRPKDQIQKMEKESLGTPYKDE